jgi:hypothetical protein
MKKAPLMIIGLGDLNQHALEFLCREERIPRIVTADVNEDLGFRKTNNAVIGASQFNKYPDVEFIHLNALDVDQTADVLSKIKPSVIVNGMTLQSWWVITQLSVNAFKAIDEARFGPWFPMHFLPAYKLMLAVKKSGINTKVVNCAFPDAVNVALAKIGLSPTVGIGNVDNAVCALRIVASKMFNAPVRSVNIFMACAHYTSYYIIRFGNSGGSPYFLKVMINDKEITSQINVDDFLKNITIFGRRLGGAKGHGVVASSICRIVKGILFDTNEIGHAPGPNGLPGGYPVRLTSDGVEVFLPDGLSMEKAIKINEAGNKFDGIESINDDGTVVLTDEKVSIMKKLLGFDKKYYKVEACENDYQELSSKFQCWANKVI